jgi:hypothetical protein
MSITFSMEQLVVFFSQPGSIVAWQLFIYGGWMPFLALFGYMWFEFRKHHKQIEFWKNTPQVCLAIDVPRENLQSLRAAEHMFSALWGVLSPGTWVERNWDGKMQLGYSFELVSLEGVIQFLVRTPVKYRDIVESAIYAQFPEVEISEVQDYMATVPLNAWEPTSPYRIWGTQARFSKHNAYPIRTHPSLENELAVEERQVDPLAPLLEAFSRIGSGELLAMQYLIRPVGDWWSYSALNLVKKMIGEKPNIKEHVGDKMVSGVMKGIVGLGNVVYSSGPVKTPDKKESKNKLGQLTPGSVDVIKAIERKMSKTCFEVKVRQIYVARKEVFTKAHGVMAIWGAMRSFAGADINALRPDGKTATEAEYLFKEQRKVWLRHKIVAAFRERSYFKGTSWLVMSVEELATLWHFPLVTVKTPMLRRAGARRGEAPGELMSVVAPAGTDLGALPVPNEPVVVEVSLDLDDKTFEQKLQPGVVVPILGTEAVAEQTTGAPRSEAQSRGGEAPPNLPIV